ncbi:hypothetical protein Ancab_021131 [Ancistrocladus abbreviatus]
MKSTNSLSSSGFLSSLPFSLIRSNPNCRAKGARVLALRRESHEHDHGFEYNGRLVDENMIVLRMRIQEMKMMENNYEAPSDWMPWEKQFDGDGAVSADEHEAELGSWDDGFDHVECAHFCSLPLLSSILMPAFFLGWHFSHC